MAFTWTEYLFPGVTPVTVQLVVLVKHVVVELPNRALAAYVVMALVPGL